MSNKKFIELHQKRISNILNALSFAFPSVILTVLVQYWQIQLLILLFFAPIPLLQYFWHRKQIKTIEKQTQKKQIIIRRYKKRINYLESILQDSTDIIFTVDVDGYILKFNKGAEKHLGYSQETIVGKPLSHLFVKESDERNVIKTVLLHGKSTNEEIPMKTNLGEVRLFNMSMSEMKNDTGEIIGLVVIAIDITEKKKLEIELHKKNELLIKLAITDSLTGLYNSRQFYNQIHKELTRIKRNPNRILSIILIDIDHFKELNDTDGHQAGDKTLKALGQIIKQCIRKDIDSGFRYGGDEFVVILPDTDNVQATVVAERIRKQFKAFSLDKTTLSIGITEAIVNENEKSLVKRADEAMYKSKKNGKDQITVII